MDLCRHATIQLANTFPLFMRGDASQPTFVSSQGLQRRRIDFIGGSDGLAFQHDGTYGWHELAYSAAKLDHLPLVSCCALLAACASNIVKRRKPVYDKQAVVQLAVSVACGHEVADQRVSQLKQLFGNLPHAPHFVDSTSHKHIIAEYLNDCIANIFPICRIPTKQQWNYFSDEAYVLILKKHELVKSLNWVGRCIKLSPDRSTFSRWHASCPRVWSRRGGWHGLIAYHPVRGMVL